MKPHRSQQAIRDEDARIKVFLAGCLKLPFGQQAAREGWILAYYDHCYDFGREPFPGEIEGIKAKDAANQANIDAQIAECDFMARYERARVSRKKMLLEQAAE